MKIVHTEVAATYAAYLDGMEAAANICGTLAEHPYDDTDAFEAATGCEAAIASCVRSMRRQAPVPDRLTSHLISNASMNVGSLETISPEAARTLLIGIARDAQELTGMNATAASKFIVENFA